MANEPKSGREILAAEMQHENHLARRDQAVARAIGAEMTDEFFKPDELEDMADVRRAIQRAAEQAAYNAIQKERELHLGDMAMLRQWVDARHNLANLALATPLIVPLD